MDEEDRKDTVDTLQQSDEWVIWKSKDKWSTTLKAADFHQLLYIKKDTQEDCWDPRSKDGVDQETSESKNRKRPTNVGSKTRQKYQWKHCIICHLRITIAG